MPYGPHTAADRARMLGALGLTSVDQLFEDIPQALHRLAQDDYEAVFTDWRFHCGTWREALQQVGGLYPDLPVIVISPVEGLEQGMREWVDVVEAGAFDLLLSPRSESAALSLLEHAVASGEARAMRATA